MSEHRHVSGALKDAEDELARELETATDPESSPVDRERACNEAARATTRIARIVADLVRNGQ